MDRLPSETPMEMSLNLSVASLNEIALVSQFERILNDCGFPSAA
ncbi:Uncharacterised protein [Chromobacterium violaceum]|uniref:Uncharacterized protein n=1 Tax=Chromobacterium violaceum TaxID=536 RepID=A0A3S4HM63_CHRVL|nr:Uncharacterised protein [Chromobacterium violaceum]